MCRPKLCLGIDDSPGVRRPTGITQHRFQAVVFWNVTCLYSYRWLLKVSYSVSKPEAMLQSVIQIRTFSTKYKYITVGCVRTPHSLNSVAILSPCSKSFLRILTVRGGEYRKQSVVMKDTTGRRTCDLVDTAASKFADNNASSSGNGRSDSIKVNFKKI